MPRIVQIEPGDVLLIGGVGEPRDLAELLIATDGLRRIGIPAIVFRGPIAIDKVSPELLRDVVEKAHSAAEGGGG